MTYWTPEELTKLHILRRNGQSPLQISIALGKSENCVKVKLTRMKKKGCCFRKLKHKARKYDAKVAEAWRNMVRQGKSYSEIHKHKAVVSRILAMEARGEL